MNPSGVSAFNQARIEWAIRLKYSPMPQLDMEMLASQLNAFRIGELRVIGKTWEVMMERDGELAVNSDKRKADAAGLEWQIVSDGSLDGDKHAAALQYFYENLTATKALDQDSTGGTDELIYQTLSALDNYYSAHEMLLRVDNPAAKEVTAEFRHTPIWFMEARRGYLGYLKHIFDMYGTPCVAGEWLTAVNHGWMRPLSMIFALKAFALRDWSIFNARYGSGFLDGQTTATKDSPEWNEAMMAMQSLANDGAVLHNDQVIFKFLEQSARNNLPFHPMVDWCNSLYAKVYRGVDLATGSKSSQPGAGGQSGGSKNAVGASVQKEESGIFLIRDAKWLTGVFNERIDRPIIRYLFKEEPRAWFALMPPLDDTNSEDLQAIQALVPMGLKIALKEVYKRFRWSVPDDNDPCLTPPASAAPDAGFDPETDIVTQRRNYQKQQDALARGEKIPDSQILSKPKETAAPPQAPVLPTEKKPTQDGKTRDAMMDEETPIAAGADPERNPGLASSGSKAYQSAASRQMPDTQVDAAGFWSRAGQSGTPPSLGYAVPNDLLVKLQAVGLANSRAAQSLRRELGKRAIQEREIALANGAGNWITVNGHAVFIGDKDLNSGPQNTKIKEANDTSSQRSKALGKQGARESGNGRITTGVIGRSASADPTEEQSAIARDNDGQKAALEKLYADKTANVEPHSANIIGEGGEHIVEHDEDSNRVIKHTKDGFGFALQPNIAPFGADVSLRQATPAEYVERIHAQNEVFGTDARIEGVSKAYDDHVGLVSSQKFISGTNPLPADLDAHMKSLGFQKVSADAIDNKHLSDKTWYHPASGYVVADVKPDNFKQDAQGKIVPVDVIVQHASKGSDLEKAMKFGTRGALSNEADIPEKIADELRAIIAKMINPALAEKFIAGLQGKTTHESEK